MGRKPKLGVWDSYEHVVHYTESTPASALERSGFHVLRIATAKPIQAPIWHEYVGHYCLYPSPWLLDWKRHLGRSAFYWLSRAERLFRRNVVGSFAPNIVALARKR